MRDLIDLYDLLPQELPDERTLDIFLKNACKIEPWDFATLDAYRNIIYRYSFMVAPDKARSSRMVKGPRPPEMTADLQAELARKREAERFAERDVAAQHHINSVLEPKRREFVSQLREALADPQVLATVEAAIAQQRKGE